jgi:hypothetical protein
MANNKNFKIKNSLQVTKLKDFAATTTSTPDGPEGEFSTTLYTGTSNTPQNINTGIDLSGSNEGIIWTKNRDTTQTHFISTTTRGATKLLSPNSSDAEETQQGLTAFLNNGFTANNLFVNNNGSNYVAWSWKSAPNFFDVVEYTGNRQDTNSYQDITHNLGSTPGMIIVKETSSADDWMVYHRSANSADGIVLKLNSTDAASDGGNVIFDVSEINSSSFRVGNMNNVNANGVSYVAYLFGHDTSSSSKIQCGSFTGNGSASGPSINLGWSPQWLLIRNSNRTANWRIIDTARDFSSTATRDGLWANANAAEDSTSPLIIARTSTGFDIKDNNSQINHSGEKIIYVAIRSVDPKFTLDLSTGNRFSFTPTAATELIFSNPPASGTPTGFSLEVENSSGYALTWPSSVKWHGGSAPGVNAGKSVYVFITTDGGTTYYGKLAGEGIA